MFDFLLPILVFSCYGVKGICTFLFLVSDVMRSGCVCCRILLDALYCCRYCMLDTDIVRTVAVLVFWFSVLFVRVVLSHGSEKMTFDVSMV